MWTWTVIHVKWYVAESKIQVDESKLPVHEMMIGGVRLWGGEIRWPYVLWSTAGVSNHLELTHVAIQQPHTPTNGLFKFPWKKTNAAFASSEAPSRIRSYAVTMCHSSSGPYLSHNVPIFWSRKGRTHRRGLNASWWKGSDCRILLQKVHTEILAESATTAAVMRRVVATR